MLGHDVRTGGLAESVLGAGRELSDFLFLPIGTGIAGAVILKGEPYGGTAGWGGEIGHIPVFPDGETVCLRPDRLPGDLRLRLGRRYSARVAATSASTPLPPRSSTPATSACPPRPCRLSRPSRSPR